MCFIYPIFKFVVGQVLLVTSKKCHNIEQFYLNTFLPSIPIYSVLYTYEINIIGQEVLF